MFSQYLLNLSEPLYDHVRPRIIHETQIIALSELCLLFQTQFMRDPDEGRPRSTLWTKCQRKQISSTTHSLISEFWFNPLYKMLNSGLSSELRISWSAKYRISCQKIET